MFLRLKWIWICKKVLKKSGAFFILFRFRKKSEIFAQLFMKTSWKARGFCANYLVLGMLKRHFTTLCQLFCKNILYLPKKNQQLKPHTQNEIFFFNFNAIYFN